MRWFTIIFASWVVLIVLFLLMSTVFLGGDTKKKIELDEDNINPIIVKERKKTLHDAKEKAPPKPANAPAIIDEELCVITVKHCEQIYGIASGGSGGPSLESQIAWCNYILYECKRRQFLDIP